MPLEGFATPAQRNEMDVQAQSQLEQGIRLGPKPETELSGWLHHQWQIFKDHRSRNGINERLLNALQAINGEYSGQVLAEIRRLGGSEIFARLTATKCRGASSLLRDIYLQPDRPWRIRPTPKPTLPENGLQAIPQMVAAEGAKSAMAGIPYDLNQARERANELMAALLAAERDKARKAAEDATREIDDKLVEGGFYASLEAFLVDLPIFPFACLKGPVVRIVDDVRWQNGRAAQVRAPRMTWTRVSPFDVFWSPGATSADDAAFIERVRYTRASINDLIGVPGYNEKAIRKILTEYDMAGAVRWVDDSTEGVRSTFENREDVYTNQAGMLDGIEYHGPVQGRMLREFGISVPDPVRDYLVQAWMVGDTIIKVQLSPSPRKRHPYYITSFEKVPGTLAGRALPDTLKDIQAATNATLRALCNNMAMSSGPQVVVNVDALAEVDDVKLHPWKQWYVTTQGQKPIEFMQPASYAQELMTVYEKLTQIGDEVSAIPRYMTGSERTGGAGRTASGMQMLMGNAQKILQTVAGNIDADVMRPVIMGLSDMLLLTSDDTALRGDENIEVLGVSASLDEQAQRQRQLEILQLSANPIDMAIITPPRRAEIWRVVAKGSGLPESAIPTKEEMEAEIAKQQAMMIGQQDPNQDPNQQNPDQKGAGGGVSKAPGGGGPGGQGGGTPPKPQGTQGPQTNLQQPMAH